jgi:hypothetical protein
MSQVISVDSIEQELNLLEAERKQQEIDREKLLQKSVNAELSKQEFGILAGFEALKEIYQRRKAKLEADKKAHENELKFQRYAELIKGQYEHYLQLEAWDKELEALQMRRDEIIRQRAEAEANNHSPMYDRIHLGLELARIDRERVQEIDKPYKVDKYM